MPVHRRRESLSIALEVKTDAPLPPPHPDIGIVSPTPRQFTFSSVLDLDGPTPRAFSFPANVQDLNLSPSTASTSTSASPSPFGSSGSDQESNGIPHFQLPHLSSSPVPLNSFNPFDSASLSSSVSLGHRRRGSACSNLSLSLERSPNGSATTGEPRRPKRGDEDYIKRPENAFILFRRECCMKKNAEEAAGEGPAQRRQRQADLSKMISQQWRSLSAEDRKYWDDLAKQRKKEHEEMYPWYVYQPTRNKEKGKKGSSEKSLSVSAEKKRGHSRSTSKSSISGAKSVSRSRRSTKSSVSSASSYYSSATESCDEGFSDSEASSLGGLSMCPPSGINGASMNFQMNLGAMQLGMAGMNVNASQTNLSSSIPPPPPVGMSPLSYLASQHAAESMSRRSSVSSVHSPNVEPVPQQVQIPHAIKLPTLLTTSRPSSTVAEHGDIQQQQPQPQQSGEANMYSQFVPAMPPAYQQQEQAFVPEYSEVQHSYVIPFEQQQQAQPQSKPQLSIATHQHFPQQYSHAHSPTSTSTGARSVPYLSPTSATSSKSAHSFVSSSANASSTSLPLSSSMLTLPLEKQHRAMSMPESPKPQHVNVNDVPVHASGAEWDNYTLPTWAMPTLFPPASVNNTSVPQYSDATGAMDMDMDMDMGLPPFTIDIPSHAQHDVSADAGVQQHVMEPFFGLQFSYEDLLDPSQL